MRKAALAAAATAALIAPHPIYAQTIGTGPVGPATTAVTNTATGLVGTTTGTVGTTTSA